MNAYVSGFTTYKRRATSEVKVGDLLLGSNHPIRIQSMTTTDTMDTKGSVEQIIRMAHAGCELARLTAPSINEALNLAEIRKALHSKGIRIPLVADIHFTPNAAEAAARIVEKVRINPGNYVDKKKFQVIEYTETEYAAELERIREKFIPLVHICKSYGTALRIGTNHGSLSDRIMSRYGDTPHGMVESAMEFLRICADEGFHNIVLSMKSSNPQVMVEAYRLLVKTMAEHQMHYPLHLGVTEAGDGKDGRIKSAMGIGSLLEDGIGDTIRVSLTEDPEFEIPVARKLVERYTQRAGHSAVPFALSDEQIFSTWNPFQFTRRATQEVGIFGGHQVPRVIADLSQTEISRETLAQTGHVYDAGIDKWHMSDLGCDLIYFGDRKPGFMLPNGVKGVYNASTWASIPDKTNSYPLIKAASLTPNSLRSSSLNIIEATTADLTEELLAVLKGNTNLVLLLSPASGHHVPDLMNALTRMQQAETGTPVILRSVSDCGDAEQVMLDAATDCGSLLLNGYSEGILISAPQLDPAFINEVSFGILQAARARITKTEYISCPSCGRTLFDLQETTALIRKQTDHLKGIKIAIMGCIVNGPGEMADADYGYVGSGPGKITLYKGKEVVKKGVNKETAVSELISIIREDGNWTDPQGLT